MQDSDDHLFERDESEPSSATQTDSSSHVNTRTSEQSAGEGSVDSENHDTGPTEHEYLIALDYQTDAERKRVEYLLKNQTHVDVEKLRGLTRIIRAPEDEFESFYEDISTKVDDLDHLRVNELSRVTITPEEIHERFVIETEAPPDRIQWAFDAIQRKRDATIEDRDRSDEYGYRQYVATTKSGTARYSYELDDVGNDETRVEVHVWGYGEAPGILRAFIEEELNYSI